MQYLYMFFFFALFFTIMIIMSKLVVKWRKLPKQYESAYILTTAFMNTGNFGAPVILLAYGEVGFSFALSIFMLQSISMHTFGVYYAGRGALSSKQAIQRIFKMPMIYSILLVFTVKGFHITVPENLYSIIDLVASAAIPSVMIVLGMQLASQNIRSLEWGSITYSTVVRLLVSPVIAFLLTLLFPFDPLLKKVLILAMSMPSAILASMYAAQFDAKPELVSSTTFISTVASFITITLLLMILG